MDIPKLFEEIKSGLIKIIFNKKDKCVGSGTGFLAEKYILTNHHVYLGYKDADMVIFRFIKSSTTSDEYTEIKLSSEKFSKLLLSGSEENSYDFAILKVPEGLPNKLYNFEIDPNEKIQTCEQIAFLGFPLEIDRITIHFGYISSIFLSHLVKTFQIDGNINSGNSGSPLINIKTGKVFGIITRSNKGLEKHFSQLKTSIKDSQKKLEPYKQIFNINGICPYEELQKSLFQVECIAKNLERSANTGIGYGFCVKPIWYDIQSLK